MPPRTLSLRAETLGELSHDELTGVVGGEPTVTCTLWDKISLAITCHTSFCPTEHARGD